MIFTFRGYQDKVMFQSVFVCEGTGRQMRTYGTNPYKCLVKHNIEKFVKTIPNLFFIM